MGLLFRVGVRLPLRGSWHGEAVTDEGLYAPNICFAVLIVPAIPHPALRATFPRGKAFLCSDIEIHNILRVFLDKFLARLDLFAHQDGENLVGLHGVFERDAAERARGGIHGGLP